MDWVSSQRISMILGFAFSAFPAVATDSAAPALDSPNDDVISVVSGGPTPKAFFSGSVPRSGAIADDATLNDVCGVGNYCWAVGERGVVVRSSDGGLSWATQMLDVDCRLTSLCFLTDQIGYVAGSEFNRFERAHQGILLKTRDGGSTWSRISTVAVSDKSEGNAKKVLPPLAFVRFFDLRNAVAIGVSDIAGAESKILRTEDGGKTWSQLESDSPIGRLQSAAFQSAEEGVVVGHGRTYSAIVGPRAVMIAAPQRSFQRISGVCLSSDGHGWMAGDGGFLLHSDSGGINWRPPAGQLASKLSDTFDYRTIDYRSGVVCVAGNPGGAVLRSADNGQTWSFRAIDSPAPVNRLRFLSPERVIAVGVFGAIHVSNDAGQTWQAVRNGDYRAAVLCLVADPQAISFRMLSKLSGDEGFRSVVAQASVQLPRAETDARLDGDRLQAAVTAVGGNQFEQDWMFARTQPLQGEVRDELLKSWERQSDARVGELLPQRLAQLLRTWRPDVVCIDRLRTTDEATNLWLQAFDHARSIADGSDPRSKNLDQVGLSPWTVTQVYARLDAGQQSTLQFRGTDLLKQLGTSSQLISSEANLLAGFTNLDFAHAKSNALVDSYGVHRLHGQSTAARHLLANAMHAPGSASRRPLAASNTPNAKVLADILQKDKTLRAAMTGTLQRAASPLSLLANLRRVGTDLPPQLALRQLLDLADMYESIENFDGEIAVLKAIAERFPDSPASAHAAEQLFQFYSSGELRFLRRNSSTVTSREDQQTQASFRIPGLPESRQPQTEPTGGVIPVNGIFKGSISKQGQGTLLAKSNGRDTIAVDQRWNNNASAAFQILQRLTPERATSADVLLRQAANLRRQMAYGENSTVLSQAAASEGLFALLAQAELQAVHDIAKSSLPMINLPKALSRPLLDGVFTEDCWQHAVELHLRSHQATAAIDPDCLIMIAWTADHLYLSGRMEFGKERVNRLDNTRDRQHDADHADHDRVSFFLDTDRDYTSGFHFTIDEAGQTSERCWRSVHWNPEWYVASDADENVWRFEVAIPVAELQTQPLTEGSVWVLRIERVVPGVLHQSLTNSDNHQANVQTGGYGLLKFIRNRK